MTSRLHLKLANWNRFLMVAVKFPCREVDWHDPDNLHQADEDRRSPSLCHGRYGQQGHHRCLGGREKINIIYLFGQQGHHRCLGGREKINNIYL
jgi:hypothetical protein